MSSSKSQLPVVLTKPPGPESRILSINTIFEERSILQTQKRKPEQTVEDVFEAYVTHIAKVYSFKDDWLKKDQVVGIILLGGTAESSKYLHLRIDVADFGADPFQSALKETPEPVVSKQKTSGGLPDGSVIVTVHLFEEAFMSSTSYEDSNFRLKQMTAKKESEWRKAALLEIGKNFIIDGKNITGALTITTTEEDTISPLYIKDEDTGDAYEVLHIIVPKKLGETNGRPTPLKDARLGWAQRVTAAATEMERKRKAKAERDRRAAENAQAKREQQEREQKAKEDAETRRKIKAEQDREKVRKEGLARTKRDEDALAELQRKRAEQDLKEKATEPAKPIPDAEEKAAAEAAAAKEGSFQTVGSKGKIDKPPVASAPPFLKRTFERTPLVSSSVAPSSPTSPAQGIPTDPSLAAIIAELQNAAAEGGRTAEVANMFSSYLVRMEQRMQQMEAKADKHDEKLDKHDEKLDKHDAKLRVMEGDLSEFVTVGKRFDSVEDRLDEFMSDHHTILNRHAITLSSDILARDVSYKNFSELKRAKGGPEEAAKFLREEFSTLKSIEELPGGFKLKYMNRHSFIKFVCESNPVRKAGNHIAHGGTKDEVLASIASIKVTEEDASQQSIKLKLTDAAEFIDARTAGTFTLPDEFTKLVPEDTERKNVVEAEVKNKVRGEVKAEIKVVIKKEEKEKINEGEEGVKEVTETKDE
ncbi:hypothetical protein BJ508DRAFT_330901 [Ascobolus immersus RN42]|uniref:Uncharacterized protein n=1 Tax=Ascobolus immersus RN42 TaxID=1160509 RepID=A0A3N4HVT4_ASCIM|nr:hypothetical protein BJ508DRAFT_330901 [Ascobolus immersus RN42]